MSSISDRQTGWACRRFAQRWALALSLAGLTLVACTSSPTAAGTITPGSSATSTISNTKSSVAGQPNASVNSESQGRTSSITKDAIKPTAASSDVDGDSASVTPTQEPQRTTPVLPPGGAGDINKTVPAHAVTTKSAVPLTATATFGGRVSASVVSAKALDAKAEAPGEISGAGVALAIKIVNGSAKTIDLSLVTVNLTGSDGSPRLQITTDPARPFAGSLNSGKSATAVYVFTIPVALRKPMTVSVSYSASTPVLLFRGTPT